MSTGGQKKTRLERVAALELPPNVVERLFGSLQRGDVWIRLGLCVLSAVFLWLILGAWAPPFSFRSGYAPSRDILARTKFQVKNDVATQTARDKAANQIRFVYIQDSAPILQMKAALKNALTEVGDAQSYDALKQSTWQEFS